MRIDAPDTSAPLRTIVVPTDFSAPARQALEWAIALASMHQARIVLVHAIQPPRLGGTAEVERMLIEAAALKLNQTSKPIVEARLALMTACHIGKPWVVIREAAQAVNADLIVIGSRGLTGLDRLLLGSTADRVLRTASCPVLTVHPSDERPAFRRVLLATDFSSSARTAMDRALRLLQAVAQPVQLWLLHVSIPPYMIGSLEVPVALMPDWNVIDQNARCNLESLAESVRSEHVEVVADVVRGYPVNAILDEARSRHVDLIALGTHSVTGIDRFFLGSVAERVIHHAPCPVLTAPLSVNAGSNRAHESSRGQSQTRGAASLTAR